MLLADDDVATRAGVRAVLERAGFDVRAEAGDRGEAVELARRLRPDLCLIDVELPGGGIAAAGEITSAIAQTAVVMLTLSRDEEDVFAALRAGAVGYLLKDVPSDRLVEAILAAARGESVLQPSVAAKVLARFARMPEDDAAPRPQPLVVPLSDRELDVLRLLAEGSSNREIAGALFLAEGTVKNHVTNVLAKLGARDRTQAALRARALGLV